MQLKHSHKDELLEGKWLNDCHIHASQQLIKLDPDLQHIRGLQDPIYGQSLQFDVVHEEMVQILHSGGNHWITVSTIGSTSPSTVQVYDSLGKALPLDTKKQVAAILHSPDKEINLEYANVQVRIITINFYSLLHRSSFMVLFFDLQKQPNHSDCGLFAIANAMALCNGQTPEHLYYDVKGMRQHLAGCLEDKVFRHFPARKRKVSQETKKSEAIKVYCSCRCLKVERG